MPERWKLISGETVVFSLSDIIKIPIDKEQPFGATYDVFIHDTEGCSVRVYIEIFLFLSFVVKTLPDVKENTKKIRRQPIR